MIRAVRAQLQGWRLLLVPVMVCAFVLSPHTRITLQAADGDLDPTFGVGGIVTTDFGTTFDVAEEVAVQPDGKIVVAGARFTSSGDFAVARYNPDGSLDATFGLGGTVYTDLNGGSSDTGRAMALQPDGKIVLAGQSVTAVSPSDEDFALVRYNSDGSLDTTFGTGGIVLTDFGAQFFEGAFSVAIDSAGRIVAAGGSFTFATQRDFAVARYNPDGSLDTTFDGDGRVTTPISLTNFDVAADVAIQADDRIVVVGFANSDVALARYATNGALDTTFGGTGAITTNFGGLFADATAVVIQPDGKVLAVGSTTSTTTTDFALVRYNADGSPDASFGTGGHVTTDFTATDVLTDVALQADGRIVVTGRTFDSVNGDDFALARYEANGTVDPTFGVAGIVRTDIATSSDEARGIAIQADGKILVAGPTAFGPAIGSGDFAVVRYEGPPPVQLTFYLQSTPMPGTGGGFIMNSTAPPTQVLVKGPSSVSWYSEPVLNGGFVSGATFEVTLPCLFGVGFPKTLRVSTTDSGGGDEQLLGEQAVGFQVCHTQTIAVPVTTPAAMPQRRLKLTLASPFAGGQPVILGSQTFLRATNFTGTANLAAPSAARARAAARKQT
jgi:uncharacterized delta-60 repeat protein